MTAVTKRTSIPPTYDSRKTGPRYYVTSRIGHYTIAFQDRIPDPFIRHTVRVGWRDLLRALLTRRFLTVTVILGADPDIIEDVLELDADYLGPHCTRRDEFGVSIAAAIRDIPAPR